VDFSFTPEQELLRRTARDVLAECAPIERVRAMIGDGAGLGDVEWRRMAALGWQGLPFPETYGGSDLGMLEMTIVLEEMGRVLLPGPFIGTVLAGLAILAAGSDAQRARWLPRLCDGSLRATVALLEESGRWDASAITAPARRDGDAFVLAGTKRFVPEAARADLLLCAVRSADERALVLVVVEAGTPGLAITPLASMDRTRPVADVALDGVRVEAANVLACDGEAVLARLLDRGRIALAADMAGGAERVLELTVEYAKVRRQFGRAIGSFQAIQHQCADMLVEVEKAKTATYYAAWADSEDADDAALAAATAKAIAGDAYRFVTARAIQVHGGIGFTWEHDLHLYFKRAQSGEVTFGDAAWSRELAARRLGL
jgi:alkylation response protein AidB-like acyl-CoA dehydrogenase